jgi:RNA recognition motif-containing protein
MKEDRVLYVGNIPCDASEEEVTAACARVLGRVQSFELVRSFDSEHIVPGSPKRKKLHRGFGFLELENEDATLAAVRNHKRLPILCRNRRLRIAYPCNHLIPGSSVVHSQEQEEICKHKIDHQSILLITSSKSSSLSVASAIPVSGQDSPILEDQPKEIQKSSRAPAATIHMTSGEQKSPIHTSDQSIDLQFSEKKQLMMAAIKKRPRSTTSEPASCCLECSIIMPVQDGAGDQKYTSSVRCYDCNRPSKRQRIDDGAHDLIHIIDRPKKTSESPHSSRYLSLQQHQCRHEHTDIKGTEILY